MEHKKVKPSPVARQRASEADLADGSIGSETSPNLRKRQAAYVERRYLLPEPIARAVAALHFAEVRS